MDNIDMAAPIVATNDLDSILSKVDLNSAEVRAARKTLADLKAKLDAATEQLAQLEMSKSSRRTEATMLAKRLLKEGLSADAVSAAILKEFGAPPTPESPKTKSKIDPALKQSVLDYIKLNGYGVRFISIERRHNGDDREDIKKALKELLKEGSIRTVGKTRGMRYYPALGV